MAVKSTRGFALKSTHGIAVKPANLAAAEKGESAPVCRTTRQFYDGEESCYIIDAKLEGNLGRYLNVSRPNGGRDGTGRPGVESELLCLERPSSLPLGSCGSHGSRGSRVPVRSSRCRRR